jgi:hypothetical protein
MVARSNYPRFLMSGVANCNCRAVAAATLLLAALTSGCGGSPPASRQQKSSAVPQITPPPPRSAPTNEPEPEPQPKPVPAVRHVGPWIEYQVASSDLIDGKGYLRLLVTPGFDSVLELSTYDSVDHEEFPSLYIRAIAKTDKLTDLVLKRVPADLFLMVENGGNIIHSLPARPIELVISEIDGKNVRGTFAGQVHDIDSAGEGPISGKFQAIVE